MHHEFNCPACLKTTRFDEGEPQQRCRHCGAFHDSAVLLADEWANVTVPTNKRAERNRLKRAYMRRLRAVRRPAALAAVRRER